MSKLDIDKSKKYLKYFAKDLKNPNAEMKVIALGMGMQSTALYLMSSMRHIERADVAIFSDPMSEHEETYKLADWLVRWSNECADAVPIHIVKKDLYNDIINSISVTKNGHNMYAAIPAFIKKDDGGVGIIMRQCTGHYKIEPLHKKVRELMGLKKGARLKPYELWLGITTDEIQRMKKNKNKKIHNRFPLIEMMMSRSDCMAFMKENGFPIPIKSACVFCPYRPDSDWSALKKENSDGWKKAIEVDKKIRKRKNISLKNDVYLHKSCKPLDEVDFTENQIDMFENECEGHCGL